MRRVAKSITDLPGSASEAAAQLWATAVVLAAVKVKPRQSAAATTHGIRGLLKTFGMILGGERAAVSKRWCGSGSRRTPCSPRSSSPMLVVLLTTREQLAVFERLVRSQPISV
jgi:hypothetical protein